MVGLKDAYGLSTVEDNIELYADWAETYDQDFAGNHGYILPQQVVRVALESGIRGHVLDVGAGTGLVGQVLNDHGIAWIDGCDISAEMLAVAKTKECYEKLFECDLTQGLDVPSDRYDAVVSAGTFTLGHVGPDAFDELLRIAKPGALFAISINAAHFGPAGFAAKFEALDGQISSLKLHSVRFYADTAHGSNADDTGFVAVFHKAI